MESLENQKPFLTANWANLALITYAVDEKVLVPLLPPECELDLRDGKAHVSLVAFDFLNTRVMGIGWPGFRNFPEINLRFYVRHGEHRGVCFIREFVRQRTVAMLARKIYGEPYVAAEMASKTFADDRSIRVEHQLNYNNTQNSLRISGSKPSTRPAEESVEHCFKEHSWGYGTRGGKLVQYNVAHPVWDVWPVKSFELDWNWSAVYGLRWEFLQNVEPCSVIFAVGSDVRVYPKA